ncbi:rRNA maturation RNase YbeY [Psittacicella gerlachiana]|uniref:Endoribonuclease YbeY n=1 Tax=Psittacicella gerlachiana TaxID=2028574 RepID=A0A3A1YB13_9GAMM|nr:rRNA maturation RNase YbeY [Psittacicella gerlachiana]RIY34536.1 rRNA maturation RNase YbeY [Psittacicella gerlachiana]
MTLKIDVNDLYSAEMQAQFLPSEKDLELWYAQVAQRLEGDFHISVTYVTPEYMQELNYQYRGKDYATNVLSFEFMGDEHETQALGFTELGDLIICPPVLEREAKEQEKPLAHHWTHICLHGLLHLLGYDHIEPEEAEEMESKEKELLAKLGIPDPYRDEDEHVQELRNSLD